MLFNSLEFLLVFLPATLLIFMMLPRRQTRLKVGWLVAVSLFFYGWWDYRFILLLVGSTSFNFWWALKVEADRSKSALTLGVATNLTLLAWFKYAGFLAANTRHLLGIDITLPEIVLPLAISFFTFHQIAYLTDVYRGHQPERSWLHYTLFIFFFPHLIAGPVIRHWELLPQFRARTFTVSRRNLSAGLALLLIGLFKKVILAAPMQSYADRVFQVSSTGDMVTLIPAWTAALMFTMQIYFDFSGYSDMALGLSRMFGVRLPVNFNSPYKSTSIIEFWRRWHITLSRFLRDYLYVPLGGNRHGEIRRNANLAAVMLLGGLWHGAAWTFVAWGAIHGALLAINHSWRKLSNGRHPTRLGKLTGWFLTFISVVVAWVIFRAPNWESVQVMISGLVGLNGMYLPESYNDRLGSLAGVVKQFGGQFGASPDTFIYPTRDELMALALCFLWVVALPNSQELLAPFRPVLEKVRPRLWRGRPLVWKPDLATGILSGLLFVVCLAVILQSPANVFIYFQF